MNVAVEIDGARADEAVLRLAAVRPCVHAQRTADRTRNAAIECKPADTRFRRRPRHLDVGHSRTGGELVAGLGLDLAEAAPETNDDARHAAIAYQQVRAETDDVDRDAVRQCPQEVGEIGFIGRREENLRRSADTKPCDVGERRVGGEPPS